MKTLNESHKIETVLLLTACINPNGMSYTVLQQIDIRRRQYEKALRWYLEHTPYRIVMAENTNSSIDTDLKDNNRVEYITFEGNNYSKEKGKGYGEALIIKEAMKQSQWLKDALLIVKITGRLIVENIQNVINEVAKLHVHTLSYELYKGGLLVAGDLNCKQKKAPSVCFLAPPDFFVDDFFIDMENCNDTLGIDFETVLYRQYMRWMGVNGGFRLLTHRIKIKGVSGSTGKAYQNYSWKARMKNYLRAYYLNKIICNRNNFTKKAFVRIFC